LHERQAYTYLVIKCEEGERRLKIKAGLNSELKNNAKA